MLILYLCPFYTVSLANLNKIELNLDIERTKESENPMQNNSSLLCDTFETNEWKVTVEESCLHPMISCKDHCGVVNQNGCSCSTMCLVDNNCCEDFTQECPLIAQKGRDKYVEMSTLNSTCRAENIFVLSGCPDNGDRSFEKWRRNYNLTQVLREVSLFDGNRIQQCLIETEKYHKFLKQFTTKATVETDLTKSVAIEKDMLMALYITDLSSGIVYENLDTFVCNAKATSLPCVWSIRGFPQFGSIARFDTMTINSLFQSPPLFQKDEYIPESTLRICSHDAQASCPRNSIYFSETLKQKCQSFRSEVKFFGAKNRANIKRYQYFLNRYCFYCIYGPEYVVMDVNVKNINPSLASLLSIDNDNKVRISAISSIFEPSPWRTAVCDPEEDLQCRAITCNEGFILRPDGNCKELKTLHLAMKMPGTNLTAKESKNLVKLLQCVLQADDGFDLYEDHIQPVLNVYSYDDKVTLFGIRVSFFSDYTNHEKALMEPIALNYGNTLARIINNHTEDTSLDDVNDDKYIYFFMKWNETINGTAEFHTVMKRKQDKAAPGPFCLSMNRWTARGTYLYCFPKKENSTDWKAKVEEIEKFNCYRNYINENWAVSTAGKNLWSSGPFGQALCLIAVFIQLTSLVKLYV